MALVVTLLLAAASGLLPAGSLQTVAGSGRGFPGDPGFAGDGGPATQARLARPAQVSADRRGGFYIADSSNQRIRHVSRTGRIQTIAGSGRQGDCGDNGMAWDLCLNLPHGVACYQFRVTSKPSVSVPWRRFCRVASAAWTLSSASCSS